MCKACPNLFFQWALAPCLANAFVESRVLAEGVTICSQGHPLQRPNQNLAPKTLGFSFLPQNLRLTNVCAQPPPKKHTGHLFSTNFAKKKKPVCGSGRFCAKISQIGVSLGMSLGMSQHVAGHVAACRGDFCARRWACRSMSLHFWHLSLGMSQHFVPLLGVLRHFAGVWANFSDSPRAQTSGGFSVFCQRGIGLKEGDFTLQRESKDFSAVAL